MKVLSLFSGIGGFDLGLERAGMEIVGQCEIDPFCNKVLAARWPEVPRYGDVRDIGMGPAQRDEQGEQKHDEASESDAPRTRDVDSRQPDGGRQPIQRLQRGACDLIVGGFPCQDLSVAGKRAGLDGARSGLWFEFHRILSELRPAFCLIENVPGLLSSNEGRDFGVIIAGLEELGYCVGWAVLDSQYFGVPQRRRRVYIVGGSSRQCVQQILSLCESGDWHSKESREAGEDFAGTLGGGAYGTGRRDEDDPNLVIPDLALPLASRTGGFRQDLDNDTYIPELSPTLSRLDAKGPSSSVDQAQLLVTHSLRAEGFDASEDGTGRGTPLVPVAYHFRTREDGSCFEETMPNVTGASVGGTGGAKLAIHTAAAVRRLTPVECERLQGFPDNWTSLDDRTPDGPRYKALGNAVSVPVIEYLGRRILAASAGSYPMKPDRCSHAVWKPEVES